ncbi:MAG TPA: IPT/TIG domain-containing protein [Bryobacteraceae bacterium]|nr:IPT/TIG domain-containing protein [Bryobacteraceae bacterium]
MNAINSSGQVVGYCECPTTEHAAIFTTSGYTAIPLPTGWTSALGYAINDAGQIGGYGANNSPSGRYGQAFVGTISGITPVPFPQGWVEAEAYAINGFGEITGDAFNGNGFQAFIGTASETTAIPLTGSFTSSQAAAINDAGQVVGKGQNGEDDAFIATTSGMTAIPSITPVAINNAGQIAGYLAFGSPETALIGTASGFTAIPLPAGATHAYVSAGCLNSSGAVVGFSDAGGWIWTASAGTQLLSSLVPAGWKFTNALSISNSGLILAIGSFQGGLSEYLELTPVGPPSITPGGVVPVFSKANTIQPGEWVSIYGTNLAGTTATWNGDFPESLGGVSVTIDGRPAYLWYVSPTQINLQAPDDSTLGSVSVTVMTEQGSIGATVDLSRFAPSFSLLDNTHVAGIILRSNGSGHYGNGTYDIIGPTGNTLGYPTVAATAGDTIVLFAVGLGPTTPAVHAGQAFSGVAPATGPVSVLINNTSVVPSFAGLSGAGLYQINLTVPAGLGTGDVPLAAIAGGARTPAGVVLSLQ